MAEEPLTEKVCATVNEAAEWLTGLGYKKTEVNTSAKAVGAARLHCGFIFSARCYVAKANISHLRDGRSFLIHKGSIIVTS